MARTRFQSSGFVRWFLRFGPAMMAGSGWYCLGYAEDQTEVGFSGHYMPIHTDDSGPVVPADRALMGQTAIVRATLSRYSDEVMGWLHMTRLGGPWGELNDDGLTYQTSPEGSIGALALAHGFWFELALVFSGGLNGSTGGYRFHLCQLADVFLVPVSSRVRKPRVIVQCDPWFAPGYAWGDSVSVPLASTYSVIRSAQEWSQAAGLDVYDPNSF